MQLGNLGSHLSTQLGVQVGKGLVQQEHLGVTDDGAAQGNTLTLTTGQSLGLAVQQVGDVQDAGSLFHAALDFVLGGLAELQAESHVIEHGHVRIQSVVLEHHGDVAVLGSDVVRQHVADVQLALADFFQASNHTQGGGLAAARGADQDDEFLVRNVQVEVGNSSDATRINLVNIFQSYACHSDFPPIFSWGQCPVFSTPGAI